MKIGIIVAMNKEYEQIAGLHSDDIILAKSGIGKVNAAITATSMILGERPDCIISSGCAGGLIPSLNPMDVIVGEQTGYHDADCGEGNELGQVQGMPVRFDADKELFEAAMSLQAAEGSKIDGGFICSGDKFCTRPEDVAAIASVFPDAKAIDMESAAIAHVCHIYKIPFLSFRMISDTIGKDSEFRIKQYRDFWAEMADRSFELFKQFVKTLK